MSKYLKASIFVIVIFFGSTLSLSSQSITPTPLSTTIPLTSTPSAVPIVTNTSPSSTSTVIESIGIIGTLILTVLGWSTTAYYQKKILETQLKANESNLQKQIDHERQLAVLEFKQRIQELDFQNELDQRKREADRRINLYPKLVELIYRTRNLSRDIADQQIPKKDSLAYIQAKNLELEEKIYEFRLDLERDDIFENVHQYKNQVMSFIMIGNNLLQYWENGEEEVAERFRTDVIDLYNQLNDSHNQVIIQFLALIEASKSD